MKKLLEINDLQISFHTYAGTMRAVRNVCFSLDRGKTLAIVGESGCGKSVTAKEIMGLVSHQTNKEVSGEILFEGKNILNFSEKEWSEFRGKDCSMIFQDALVSLNPTIRIGRQVVENLKNHERNLSKKEMRDRVVEMLRLTGIPEPELCLEKYPHELSGGMRQRVMIAMALVTHPKLLIADEPTTALDVTIQAQIMKILRDLQKKLDMSIILITHDLGLVADMADDILIMYAGKSVEYGDCEQIFYSPTHPYTCALLNAVPHIEGENKKMLTTIEGSLPNMLQPPKGCAFCNRCPYAMNICKEKMPEEYASDNHKVYCWLLDERADIIDIPYDLRRIKNDKR